MGIYDWQGCIYCHPPRQRVFDFLLRVNRMSYRQGSVTMLEAVRHHFVGDMYFREMDLPAGYMMATHKHNYDHASVVLKGWGTLYWGTESQEYKPGDILHIAAGIEHRFVAHRNSR